MAVIHAGLAGLVLGICPADGGHGPVDLLSGAGGVVGHGQAGVHGAHDGLTQVDVRDLLGIDADIAVAQLIGGSLLDALAGQLIDLVDVVGGELGGDEVDSAGLQDVQSVGGADHLVADLVDVGLAQQEVLVGLEVNNVILVESVAVGVVAVIVVGGNISTGTHGHLDVAGGLDLLGHEVIGAEIDTELVVGDVHVVAFGIVVLRRNGEGKVPDGLGVNTVDGDLQHIVLVFVLDGAVIVVVMGNGVLAALGGDLGHIGGVAQGNNAGDVGNCQGAVIGNVLVEDDFLSLGGELGAQGLCGCPVQQDLIQVLLDLGLVDIVDGGVHVLDHVGVIQLGDLLNLGLDILVGHGVLGVFHGNVAFCVHEAGDGILELLT